jgi:hypothetical protein
VATAAAIRRPKTVLHVRGTWSAREDRVPSAVWLGILWVGMVAGFGMDFKRYLHRAPAAPTIVHLHAAVFSVWMLLLTAQVLLVLGDRVAWHKRLGWFAAGWACLMAVLGPWAAMTVQAIDLHTRNSDPAFFSVNLVDLGGFLVLLAWGIALRKNPAAHKRMMILATISLADPGFNRLMGYVFPVVPTTAVQGFFYVFYGNLLLVALMAGWDLFRGRLMRSFVLGAAGLLAAEYMAALLYFWGPWKTLTESWVQSWVQHFG